MKQLSLSMSLLMITFFNIANAQLNFEKGFGLADSSAVFASKVLQTSDGGYLLIGQNYSANIFSYAIIIKTTATGDTVWTKIIRDTNPSTRIYPNCGVELPNAQGYIIAGNSNISTNVFNAFAFALDINGNLVWAKEYFHPSITTEENIYSCTNSLDGNILLSGHMNSGLNYLIMKIDLNGNVIWSQGLQSVYNNSTVNNDKIIQLQDSSIIVCGSTQSYIVNNIQYIRTFIGKFSHDGSFLWAKTYGDSLTLTEPNSISFDNNNRLIVSGRHSLLTTGQPPTIGFLMAIDTAGNLYWYREYENFTNNVTGIYSAKISGNGEISVLKDRITPNWEDKQLFRTDTAGIPIWNKYFIPAAATSFYMRDFIETSDNGFAICGGFSDNSPKMLLVKIDSLGTFNCSTLDISINSTFQTIPFQNLNPNIMIFSMNDSSKTYSESSGFILFDICTGTGINEENNVTNAFSIYPNPANRIINISLIKNENVTILNILGNVIIEKFFNAKGKYELDISSLAAGIYFIRAGNEVRKFVKE